MSLVVLAAALSGCTSGSDTAESAPSGGDSGRETGLETRDTALAVDTDVPCIDHALLIVDCTDQVEAGDGGGSTWQGLDVDDQDLAGELHERLRDHTSVSYDGVWEAFEQTDARADGSVWDLYGDPGDGEPAYRYQFGQDQCGEYDSEGDCYNREHTFPQSWSDDAAPMRSDLHQVFPVDGWVNGLRGNLPFGPARVEVSTTGGSVKGRSQACDYEGTVFEPVDAFKGDVARAILYMSVRYRGEDGGWAESSASQGAKLEPWFEAVMIAWHLEDPVSDKERDRNDAVEAVQDNRNPFVDRPELVCGVADF